MSEWVAVLAVFWVLWALDGVRLNPRRGFTAVGGGRGRRGAPGGRMRFSRLSLPGLWPHAWRIFTADVPLSFSPLGLSNRPAGTAGRPTEITVRVQAWRWEDVREIGVARGWIFVNGAAFCPNTGHVTGPQLLDLAREPIEIRTRRIRALMDSWLRPVQVRRRVRVLVGRTRLPVALSAIALLVWIAVSVYFGADIPSRLAPRWSEAIARVMPAVLAAVLGLHVAGVVAAWRSVRRLKAVTAHKRTSNLFSALMLPPQALRLRALAGEGFFRAQHPLSVALAVGGKVAAGPAFAVVADLRWPLEVTGEAGLSREVAGWFRTELAARIDRLLVSAQLTPETLFAAPQPNSNASCAYCPRCRDQFVPGAVTCPHGVPLVPLVCDAR